MYDIVWTPLFKTESYIKNISYDTQWWMLSYLTPHDLMILRSTCQDIYKCIQTYASLLVSRQKQLMDPFNIFARSIMLNSIMSIDRKKNLKKVSK